MTFAAPTSDFYDDGLVHSHDWSRTTRLASTIVRPATRSRLSMRRLADSKQASGSFLKKRIRKLLRI